MESNLNKKWECACQCKLSVSLFQSHTQFDPREERVKLYSSKRRTCNLAFAQYLGAAIVAVEKQQVLHILIVCACVCARACVCAFV